MIMVNIFALILLYPIYGEGELTQAFCRHTAVKGHIYVSFKGFMRLFLKISKYLIISLSLNIELDSIY